ncbi:hypothetical protein [Breoghania sp.]|uniref:hypothetical protein n=1 Tax=Breoghania sp. TaxID=2065378 RepID=UPI002AAAF08F|nr:hypothetical protein [Breoghania sp.]
MTTRKAILAAAVLLACGPVLKGTASAATAQVDFKRFLSTPAGAAGVAAAVAGLGTCDTPINWEYGFDETLGDVSTDVLFLGCTETIDGEDDPFEKSVVAKFMFLDGKPSLVSLQYLP